MIIAKRIVALILALLCVFAMASLVSCGKETTVDALSALNQKQAPDAYMVIIPADADSALVKAADELSEAISDKTGAECRAEYDNAMTANTKAVFEVFVGNVDSALVASEFYGLRRDDYICKAFEGYIVLGGKSSGASVKAVERFMSDIIPYATTALLMDEDAEFAGYAEYELDSLKLCGFDFSDYQIAYFGERTGAVAELAYNFRELVADKCGAYSEIVPLTETEDDKKEIILRIDDGIGFEGVVSITKAGEDVCITSDSSYGLSVGVERLYTLMLSDASDGSASLDINYELTYTYSASDISLITVVPHSQYPKDKIDFSLALAKMINASDADVVSLASVDTDTLGFIVSNLDERFAAACVGESDRAVAVYNSNKLSLSECSLSNQMVTLSFEIKSTGRKTRVYSVLETGDGERDSLIEALKEKLQGSDAPSLAVFYSRVSPSDEMLVSGNNIATQYNGIIGNDGGCRHAIFTTANTLDCYQKELVEDRDGGYTVLSVRTRDLYSSEYLALLASRS